MPRSRTMKLSSRHSVKSLRCRCTLWSPPGSRWCALSAAIIWRKIWRCLHRGWKNCRYGSKPPRPTCSCIRRISPRRPSWWTLCGIRCAPPFPTSARRRQYHNNLLFSDVPTYDNECHLPTEREFVWLARCMPCWRHCC